jgi:membrane protease YdiL (CAAX protease family)
VAYKWLVEHITHKPMPGLIMAPWINAIIEERSSLGFIAVGFVLGWARHKSGGLALPVILHCVNNSAALLLAMLRTIGG